MLKKKSPFHSWKSLITRMGAGVLLLVVGIGGIGLGTRFSSTPAQANPVALAAPPVAIASLEALSVTVALAAGVGIISQVQKKEFQASIESMMDKVWELSEAALSSMIQAVKDQTRMLQSMLSSPASCPIEAPGRTLPQSMPGSSNQKDPGKRPDKKCILQSACDMAQKLVPTTPFRGQWLELGLTLDEFKSACEIIQTLTSTKKLPQNMLTKGELRKLGWDPVRGNMGKLGGKYRVGGDFYRNDAGKLPQGVWHEADLAPARGGFRGPKRVFYSPQGDIVLSNDHGVKDFQHVRFCKDGPLN